MSLVLLCQNPPRARLRRRILLLTAFAALNTGCHGEPATARSRSETRVPVTVARVVQKAMPVEVVAVGNVEQFAIVSVLAQVSGRIEKVHFKEGDSVSKGDLLFSLDRRPFQAALNEAIAKRDRNRVLAANAKSDLERYQGLVGKDYVSREQFDRIQTEALAAEATLRADMSAVESAQLNLQYTTIRSPINGRTGSLLVDQGNVVKANDKPLVEIRQIRPIYVRFAVPERYLSRIRKRRAEEALSVRATPRAQDAEPARGTLSFIENTVDVASGTIGLKALFENQNQALWPGQYVDVVLELSVQDKAIVAPATAVQQSREGDYCFVLRDDGTVEMRNIRVLRTIDQQAVVAEGLGSGDIVVTDGQLRLQNGTKVQIKQPQAASRGDSRGEDRAQIGRVPADNARDSSTAGKKAGSHP